MSVATAQNPTATASVICPSSLCAAAEIAENAITQNQSISQPPNTVLHAASKRCSAVSTSSALMLSGGRKRIDSRAPDGMTSMCCANAACCSFCAWFLWVCGGGGGGGVGGGGAVDGAGAGAWGAKTNQLQRREQRRKWRDRVAHHSTLPHFPPFPSFSLLPPSGAPSQRPFRASSAGGCWGLLSRRIQPPPSGHVPSHR